MEIQWKWILIPLALTLVFFGVFAIASIGILIDIVGATMSFFVELFRPTTPFRFFFL